MSDTANPSLTATGHEIDTRTAHNAARRVAEHAADAAEATELLDMLGIHPARPEIVQD